MYKVVVKHQIGHNFTDQEIEELRRELEILKRENRELTVCFFPLLLSNEHAIINTYY